MVVAESDRSKSLTRVAAIERRLEPLVRRSLRSVQREIVSDLGLPTSKEAERALVAAMNPAALARVIALWRREMDERITPGLLTAIHLSQAWTVDRLPAPIGVYLGANIRDVRAISLLGSIRNRLVGVGDTLYQESSQALMRSLEQGEGVEKAAARVRHALDVSTERATVIARTEAAAVVNGADHTIAQELRAAEIAYSREWLATNDLRTRTSHLEANGQRVGVDEPFRVGEALLEFPGDPEGPAEEVIQCRCTTLLDVDERDAETLATRSG